VTFAVCYSDRCCFRYFRAAAVFLILTLCRLMLSTFMQYTKYPAGLKLPFKKLLSIQEHHFNHGPYLLSNDHQYLLLYPDGMESMKNFSLDQLAIYMREDGGRKLLWLSADVFLWPEFYYASGFTCPFRCSFRHNSICLYHRSGRNFVITGQPIISSLLCNMATTSDYVKFYGCF
jgi:hypothetical protein